MEANGDDPPLADRPGSIWRETVERLTARLEEEGLDRDRARELGEAAVIVCALRYHVRSLEHALHLATDQARAMR